MTKPKLGPDGIRLNPPRARRQITIDLEALPEDLRQALVDRAKPGYVMPEGLKAQRKKTAAAKWRKRAIAAGIKAEIQKPEGKPRVVPGYAERVLALCGDWITQTEMVAALGLYRGAVSNTVNKLWKAGKLLKRKNPDAAENRFGVVGVAACAFQYRAALPVQECVKPNEGSTPEG